MKQSKQVNLRQQTVEKTVKSKNKHSKPKIVIHGG